MEFKDLVTLYFERWNAMQTFWNFHIAIILGLLAFFGSDHARPRSLAWVLSIAFAVFAAVNLAGLLGVTRQRLAIKKLISSAAVDTKAVDPKAADSKYAELKNAIVDSGATRGWVWFMHLSGDVATIAAIWFLTLRAA